MTQFDLPTKTIRVIDRFATTMTVRTLQGAMNVDLERLALADHHAINRDIGEVQQRLKGLFIKHHDQQRSNRVLAEDRSQTTDL